MTPEQERDAWIRSGYEPEFMVWGPDVHESGPHFDVVDAECEHIARCQSKEDAEILTRALTMYNNAMWRLESPSGGTDK